MKATLLALLILPLMAASAATLYKVVKPDGTVIYTDKPVAGSTPVSLGKLNSVSMPPPPKPVTPAKPDEPEVDYQLKLLEPAQDAILRNNLGQVIVRGQLQPADAGQFELYVDDQLVQTSSNPSFRLEDIYRGEHRARIDYKGKSGKVLASSPTHTFYMYRASRFINNF